MTTLTSVVGRVGGEDQHLAKYPLRAILLAALASARPASTARRGAGSTLFATWRISSRSLYVACHPCSAQILADRQSSISGGRCDEAYRLTGHSLYEMSRAHGGRDPGPRRTTWRGEQGGLPRGPAHAAAGHRYAATRVPLSSTAWRPASESVTSAESGGMGCETGLARPARGHRPLAHARVVINDGTPTPPTKAIGPLGEVLGRHPLDPPLARCRRWCDNVRELNSSRNGAGDHDGPAVGRLHPLVLLVAAAGIAWQFAQSRSLFQRWAGRHGDLILSSGRPRTDRPSTTSPSRTRPEPCGAAGGGPACGPTT
jgi:hypothetical protein